MTRGSDCERRRLWSVFADQFLDTETRTWLPATAHLAVRAPFSRAELRAIWRFEVAPAVGANLLDVAGEWAGWDEAWLFARIEAGLVRPSMRPRWWTRPAGWILSAVVTPIWNAIERLMDHLERLPVPARPTVVSDLTLLAEHFFDFGGRLHPPTDSTPSKLAALYADVFLPIYSPLVVACPGLGESKGICRARVQTWLRRLANRSSSDGR